MAKRFVFKKNQSVGAAAAELDRRYLSQCFVDTGDMAILCDCEDPKRILVGRTGSGKSALLRRLAEVQEHVIRIQPEILSLKYISNSDTLRFFTEVGVQMDIFYRLLWRHVFCVEILKERFRIDTESKQQSFFEFIWTLIPRNKNHEQALAYLRQWGDSFWKDTEYRIKEVTQKLETQLRGSLEGKLPTALALNASTARTLSEEKKGEVVRQAQEVVNDVQIRELSAVIDLLDEVLNTNDQQKFYITIDQLDDDWIEDPLRFRLIRALITTSLDFAKIRCVKIIVAIRQDLLDRVFRYARGPGFQEEKYRSSMLEVSWTPQQLTQLLDARIDLLIRDQYTKGTVTHKDVLPSKLGNQPTIQYMLERTFHRPRDLIQFFNACIVSADGQPVVSSKALLEAEGAYSRDRLRALADEWYSLYPNLLHLAEVLKKRSAILSIRDLPTTDFESNLLQLWLAGNAREGLDFDLMDKLWNSGIDSVHYRAEVVRVFYKVGLVGLKTDSYLPISWSYDKAESVSSAEIAEDTRVAIHKVFWRTLGISGRAIDF